MAFQAQPAVMLIAAVFVLAVAGIVLVAVCSDGDPNFVVVTPDGTIAVGGATPDEGGQPSIEPTLPPVDTPTPETSRVYTVQPGDSLSGICTDIVPNLPLDECIDAIIALNDLASADQISIDQDLILPGAGPLPTRVPTATPDPDAPTPTPAPTSTPESLSFSGNTTTATDAIQPQGAVTVITLSHSGSGEFIVNAFTAGQQISLVNVDGPYSGSRPLITNASFTLTIQAEADWTISISSVASGGSPIVTSTGDSVSALFDPPEDGTWHILHVGSGNFIVWLRCADTDELVVNEIGGIDSLFAVDFGPGPCFWDVKANGLWSMNPG